MEIDIGTDSDNGIPAASALAMAVMESTGIRKLIDDVCIWDRKQRILSPGMAVKAMIGPIFDVSNKLPLYNLSIFYETSPVDILFGKRVTVPSLGDRAFARSLDTLFDADLEGLLWACAERVRGMYGFSSDVLHMDATNFSVYAMERPDEEDGVAMPKRSGHAKDGRNDLLQYAMQAVCDSDRILRYLRPYSGNESDCTMNLNTLNDLAGRTDTSATTVVADCKLVNARIIDRMYELGFGFVSKCPESFGKRIREVIVNSAYADGMTVSDGRKDRGVYDTDAEVDKRSLRFVAYRNPSDIVKTRRYVELQGKKNAETLMARFLRDRFKCESDAKDEFSRALKKLGDTAYVITAEYVPHLVHVKTTRRGRPPAGHEPERKTEWEIVVTMVFDPMKAEMMSKRDSINVLVTNLPRSIEDAENLRSGATTGTVLKLYMDEYKIEHTYRLMKSGMGVDSVYLHTPSRENAMMFVVGTATLVADIITAVLKRNGVRKTAMRICDELMSLRIVYDREHDRLLMRGLAERKTQLMSYLETMKTDPTLMLGYKD
jgi:transposase